MLPLLLLFLSILPLLLVLINMKMLPVVSVTNLGIFFDVFDGDLGLLYRFIETVCLQLQKFTVRCVV